MFMYCKRTFLPIINAVVCSKGDTGIRAVLENTSIRLHSVA